MRVCVCAHDALPFWPTLDTRRGPGRPSRRWHSSCRGRRTASSSERSWPAPAPCVGKPTQAPRKVRFVVRLVGALWVVVAVRGCGGGSEQATGNVSGSNKSRVQPQQCAVSLQHSCTRVELVSCCASNFTHLDTRLTAWVCCTFCQDRGGGGGGGEVFLWAVTSWDTFLCNLKDTVDNVSCLTSVDYNIYNSEVLRL